MIHTALQDRLIAVPETRELDLFAALLERRGARVLRAPLVAILDAPDPEPVLAWLRDFSLRGCDELILLTGEGLRRLLGCIDRHEPALRTSFLTALARAVKITRGPKPARALRELGLNAELAADPPTTAGVIVALRGLDLRGHRVGVQLYGSDPNIPLREYLQSAGAELRAVAPYVYANASDDAAVRALVERLATGDVDAIAFTSKAQVTRLFAVAPAARVQAALAATQVAAVGPVVAAELVAHGVTVSAQPRANWFLKPLAAELAHLLEHVLPGRASHGGGVDDQA